MGAVGGTHPRSVPLPAREAVAVSDGLRTSVLIPSYQRRDALAQCLNGLAKQTVPPDETIVIWQGEDVATRDLCLGARERFGLPVTTVHQPDPGIVPAENCGLDKATGDIVLLIDDDAVAPPDWVERHLTHYDDERVGAVGATVLNREPDGTRYPSRETGPIGQLSWLGRVRGNTYDHPSTWRSRAVLDVVHAAAGNLSLRRTAFNRFESELLPYWQLFELDVCLQVGRNGYRVLFDFGIPVEHTPSSGAYSPGRSGDLQHKVYNAAYNQALVLSKHSPFGLRTVRLLYLTSVGSVSTPGLLGSFVAARRFGNWGRELHILVRTWRSLLRGWSAGRARRP